MIFYNIYINCLFIPRSWFIEQPYWINNPELPERNIDELLPSNCGQRAKDFNDDDDLIFQKVVHGSIAPKGTYPWQVNHFNENRIVNFTFLRYYIITNCRYLVIYIHISFIKANTAWNVKFYLKIFIQLPKSFIVL